MALEYARNRAETLIEQIDLCQKTETAFKKVVTEYIAPKNKQPFLSPDSTIALNGIIEELEKKRGILESLISEDEYADLLLSLFDQKISAAPNAELLQQLHEKAAERFANKIPPGYSDQKSKEVPRAYGDYIVWRQLMDIATKEKKDFIFVTDDSKEDWRLKFSGKTIGPRPELLEEFRRETGQRVWIFNSEGFLIATKKAGSSDVADSVIEEVSAHLVAQSLVGVSEDKLSLPEIEHEETAGAVSDAKLSGHRIVSDEASLRQTKLTTPGEETAARTDKKMAASEEDDGGEE